MSANAVFVDGNVLAISRSMTNLTCVAQARQLLTWYLQRFCTQFQCVPIKHCYLLPPFQYLCAKRLAFSLVYMTYMLGLDRQNGNKAQPNHFFFLKHAQSLFCRTWISFITPAFVCHCIRHTKVDSYVLVVIAYILDVFIWTGPFLWWNM